MGGAAAGARRPCPYDSPRFSFLSSFIPAPPCVHWVVQIATVLPDTRSLQVGRDGDRGQRPPFCLGSPANGGDLVCLQYGMRCCSLTRGLLHINSRQPNLELTRLVAQTNLLLAGCDWVLLVVCLSVFVPRTVYGYPSRLVGPCVNMEQRAMRHCISGSPQKKKALAQLPAPRSRGSIHFGLSKNASLKSRL